MKPRFDPRRRHRRSIRWKGYDYARAGAYFVTLCTRGRECVLDEPIVAGIILDVWEALPARFPTIALDEFVVMPNHVHLIVWLQSMMGAGASPTPTGETDGDDIGATLAVARDAVAHDVVAHDARVGASPAPTWVIPEPETVNDHPTLGDVMGAFKSLVFTVYLDWVEAYDPNRRAKFWQRNYYEHVVRNERELHAIRRYIQNNPLKWALDRDNPTNRRREAETVDDYLKDAGIL
ncbi:MAG: hypothetical protein AAB382_00895 [Chloroflexota bacterium]